MTKKNKKKKKKQSCNEFVPSVNYWDFSSVSELPTFSGNGHTTKGGAAEIEVSIAIGTIPTGALVGDDYSHCSSRANVVVQTLHFVTSSTTFTISEQNRTHSPNSSL